MNDKISPIWSPTKYNAWRSARRGNLMRKVPDDCAVASIAGV
jgi:hypothetical protein